MNIILVSDKDTVKEFIRLPRYIYREDENWIAPLEKDISGVFDPARNPVLQHGEFARWILKDGKKTIGRVAAFINHKAVQAMDHPAGGMGFFDCVDNESAAFMLFDTARQWLESRGMKAMDGPINFGERDRFWGLLVKGFGPPSYMEAYNPPYYRRFFEDYGFKVYFEQVTYKIRREDFSLGRFERIAERVTHKPEYEFRHLEKGKLEKYAGDFTEIYNKAWSKFENFKPVTAKEVLMLFKEMSPVMIPEYIWFAYVHNEPAGFIVMLPDVNMLFKHLNGKFNLWAKLKFLWYRQMKPIRNLKGLVFGFIPKYQNLGLDAALVYKFHLHVIKSDRIRTVGISWIGSFNPKMHSLMTALSAIPDKTHITYRKLFDESLPFRPFSLGEYSDDSTPHEKLHR
jgi:hypothetical protein